MKPSLTHTKKRLLHLASAVLLLMSVCAAKAQILLTINESNPSAVTITATGGLSAADASTLINNGVDLLAFFTSSVGFDTFTVSPSSTLTTSGFAGSGPYFDNAVGDNYSLQNIDLTLYSSNTEARETFTTDSPAFSGVMTLNLSGAALPAPGTSGTIITGYSGSSPNTVIGQWQVAEISAPEPTSSMLLIGSLALLALGRTRLQAIRLRARSTVRVD